MKMPKTSKLQRATKAVFRWLNKTQSDIGSIVQKVARRYKVSMHELWKSVQAQAMTASYA